MYKAQLVIKDVRSLHPSLSSVLHRRPPPPVVVHLKQQQLSLLYLINSFPWYIISVLGFKAVHILSQVILLLREGRAGFI